ncbi:ATP-binding protein [Pseudonocardia acaciae]|uniref:ATP-binding protein n=1 Tax=Pseudonocardia acaciae TaxID=551276 RepID=UPI00048FCD9E|nr:ATP-binding protein [Pseudonocardia acaciae]
MDAAERGPDISNLFSGDGHLRIDGAGGISGINSATGGVFERVLGADAAELVSLRRAFRGWLRKVGWPAERADDLVLTLARTMIGLVEHAHPAGTPEPNRELRVRAAHTRAPGGRRHVVVEVADAGPLSPVRTNPGVLFVGWYHTDPGRDMTILRLPESVTRKLSAQAEREGRPLEAIAADAIDAYIGSYAARGL